MPDSRFVRKLWLEMSRKDSKMATVSRLFCVLLSVSYPDVLASIFWNSVDDNLSVNVWLSSYTVTARPKYGAPFFILVPL